MISRNKIKYINSLRIKKNRNERKQFIAEGDKLIHDLIASDFNVNSIIATKDWIDKFNGNLLSFVDEINEVSSDELKKVSNLKTPNSVLAIVDIPFHDLIPEDFANILSLVLDDIQDPGNLGTIIRTADWFGIENIFCSSNSVDVYNPKVVQATMGSISRVKVHYLELKPFLKKLSKEHEIPIYGTFLEGNNIYNQNLSNKGLIIFGNEGAGISENIKSLISNKLFIPNYPKGQKTSESLNVSTAVSIICSEFRRKQ